MHVYIPYHEGSPQPWTLHWARHYCPEAVPVRVRLGGGYYAEQIAAWWAQGEPFIVVEHDVVPWPGAVQQLAVCPEPWCAFSHHTSPDHRFVRFGSVEMSCFKVIPEQLGPTPFPDEPVPWPATDSVLAQKLFERGHMVHQHWPSVCNLNGDYPLNPAPLRERSA